MLAAGPGLAPAGLPWPGVALRALRASRGAAAGGAGASAPLGARATVEQAAAPAAAAVSACAGAALAAASARRARRRGLQRRRAGPPQVIDVAASDGAGAPAGSAPPTDAAALLRLGLFDASLRAADPSARALRAAALAGLRRYAEARAEADAVGGPEGALLRAAAERLERQSAGEYTFDELYGTALQGQRRGGVVPVPAGAPPAELLPDFADYVGPVEVWRTERGRCLFAKEDVRAGTLLMCEAPLVKSVGAVQGGLDYSFREALQRAVVASPHAARVAGLLAHGAGEAPMVDINDFSWGASNADEATFDDLPALADDRADAIGSTNCFNSFGCSALHPAIAMTNHSCVPNTTVVAIGDVNFMRATSAIGEGQEINISYFDVLRPFNERHRLMQSFRFDCQCPRCTFERKLPEALRAEGASVDEVEAALADPATGVDPESREAAWLRASHAKAYKEQLEATFPFSDEAAQRRRRLLRAVEATDPASFTHCKYSLLDWISVRNGPEGPQGQAAQQSMRYIDLVHSTRYGPIPGGRIVEILKHTKAALESFGVGEEFCNPPTPQSQAVPAAPAAAPPAASAPAAAPAAPAAAAPAAATPAPAPAPAVKATAKFELLD